MREPVTRAATFSFFACFPLDELLDVGVVNVHDDHLGGAPSGTAGFDCGGSAVEDLQEAHQP